MNGFVVDRLGVVTAPVLFAAREHPRLERMIKRKFSRPLDAENAVELVRNSRGIEETK